MNNLIYAYNKTSDAGIDTSSFSVFMRGCNLCCPYCMNSKLIAKIDNTDSKILEKLKKDVEEYKPIMIFISGGEATENPIDLSTAIALFQSWGCKIGLSTNGTNPEVLKNNISDIAYVALDFKGNIDIYKKLGNLEYFSKVLSSWLILRDKMRRIDTFNYEIRTTLYPPFITMPVLLDMSRFFYKDEKWVLQQFRPVKFMPCEDAHNINPFSEKKLKTIKSILSKIISDITIRYV